VWRTVNQLRQRKRKRRRQAILLEKGGEGKRLYFQSGGRRVSHGITLEEEGERKPSFFCGKGGGKGNHFDLRGEGERREEGAFTKGEKEEERVLGGVCWEKKRKGRKKAVGRGKRSRTPRRRGGRNSLEVYHLGEGMGRRGTSLGQGRRRKKEEIATSLRRRGGIYCLREEVREGVRGELQFWGGGGGGKGWGRFSHSYTRKQKRGGGKRGNQRDFFAWEICGGGEKCEGETGRGGGKKRRGRVLCLEGKREKKRGASN